MSPRPTRKAPRPIAPFPATANTVNTVNVSGQLDVQLGTGVTRHHNGDEDDDGGRERRYGAQDGGPSLVPGSLVAQGADEGASGSTSRGGIVVTRQVTVEVQPLSRSTGERRSARVRGRERDRDEKPDGGRPERLERPAEHVNVDGQQAAGQGSDGAVEQEVEKLVGLPSSGTEVTGTGYRPASTSGQPSAAIPQPTESGISGNKPQAKVSSSTTTIAKLAKPAPPRKSTPRTKPPVQPRGTSSIPTTNLAAASAPTSTSTSTDPKYKGKPIERRVLPARIRRAAGGGLDGMRDVEEMVVDWLQRWGEPVTTPPDGLPILLTTLPLEMLNPPPVFTPTYSSSGQEQSNGPPITLTPSRKIDPASAGIVTVKMEGADALVDVKGENTLGKEEMIETPGWVMVKPGEDDEQEAREELENGPFIGIGSRPGTGTGGVGKGKGIVSPVKRLRRMHDEPEEDTSDAHYIQLHRKHEAFERRQRLREKEKLQFERYKLRSRIDLLRNLSKPAWASIVATILARDEDGWKSGRAKVGKEGEEWLRRRLLKEGEEVMKRYEELLPPENRKHKAGAGVNTHQHHLPTDATPNSTRFPSPSGSTCASRIQSLTPEPTVLPARVAALRDPVLGSTGKRKRSSMGTSKGRPSSALGERNRDRTENGNEKSDGVQEEEGDSSGWKKVAKTYTGKKQSVQSTRRPDVDGNGSEGEAQVMNDGDGDGNGDGNGEGAEQPWNQNSLLDPMSSSHRPPQVSASPPRSPPFFPPLTASGLPCLIEAASRRESALQEAKASKARAAEPRKGRLISWEKTRTSTRLGVVSPFGLPIPGVVEYKYEFTLTEEEDFWPIIAEREATANRHRRESLLGQTGMNGLENVGTSSNGSVHNEGSTRQVEQTAVSGTEKMENIVVL
ncbi:hypothetical protein C365_02413 [Cryptococcus neoformans Bt85]|nr:hypothetical protein C365_02413 [Cryptococcus neoformans var. grubii Bt85]